MAPEQRASKGGRNLRNVWAIPTKGYKEAHFATFPEALVEPMILASCPSHVCTSCKEPYARIDHPASFRSTCFCTAAHEPGIVLDPFCGSGTTLVVAQRLGRDSIGIEISEEYAQLAADRIERCGIKSSE